MPRKHEPYVYDKKRARAAILRIVGAPDLRLVPAPRGWRPPNVLDLLELANEGETDLGLVGGPIRRPVSLPSNKGHSRRGAIRTANSVAMATTKGRA